MSAEPTSVAAYLSQLPADRRELIATVRDVVRRRMPPGYQEHVAFGMITWTVPLERYQATYNEQPLLYAGLASRKNYCSIYLMSLYTGSDDEQAFREKWTAGGRKLDMGKSCLRFKRLEALDLDLIGATIASTPVEEFIARCEAARA